MSSFALFGTISQLVTTPVRRSSFSKSGNAISAFSAGAPAARPCALPLFFDARLSWLTSPLSPGLTVAAAIIASTCFASMRLARYSYAPSAQSSRAAEAESHVHASSPKSARALSA